MDCFPSCVCQKKKNHLRDLNVVKLYRLYLCNKKNYIVHMHFYLFRYKSFIIILAKIRRCNKFWNIYILFLFFYYYNFIGTGGGGGLLGGLVPTSAHFFAKWSKTFFGCQEFWSPPPPQLSIFFQRHCSLKFERKTRDFVWFMYLFNVSFIYTF